MAVEDGSTPGLNDHLRASDADRQHVADRLRAALDEGRLTLLEYDERLGAAYGALTYGELAKVTHDLPGPASPPDLLPATAPPSATGPAGPVATDPANRVPAAQQPARPGVGGTKAYLIQQGRGWLGGAVITNGIWAATSGFDWHSYWPGIVLPIWAVAIVGGLISGNHRKDPTGSSGTAAGPGQDAADPRTGELDPHRGQPHWRFDHSDRRADRHQARADRRDRRYPDQS